MLILCRLVDKINVSIGQDPTSKSLIGVLDIYGFESFKHNRWELRIDEPFDPYKEYAYSGVFNIFILVCLWVRQLLCLNVVICFAALNSSALTSQMRNCSNTLTR